MTKWFTYNLLLCLIFLLTSCSHSTPKLQERKIASVQPQNPVIALLGSDIEKTQMLIEEALVWREKAAASYNEFSLAANTKHLDHEQLIRMQKSGTYYLDIRERLLGIAQGKEWLTDTQDKIEYGPGKGTFISKKHYSGLARIFHWRDTREINLDPNDAGGRVLLTELKLALASALVLYDNYLIGIYPYQKEKKIRYLLNRDFPELQGKLRALTNHFLDPSNRKKLARAAELFLKDIEWKKSNLSDLVEKEDTYLDQLIFESLTFNFLTEGNSFGPNWLSFAENNVYDARRLTRRTFSFYTSKFFGNSMGLVAFRKGYLTHLSPEERMDITKTLKPLDILLEKTPFRLTDQFIPGHWGHVAIWVGTEEELRAMGIWDHPKVAPYQELIRSGHHIVEALRPGVQINTLEHFLNIDDLLALRHPELQKEENFEIKKEYLLRTFEQIGKDYDFNFDVQTDKKIVCSELAYVVYHNIQWPTDKTLGRYTISPDNVAIKALQGPLLPVLLYHEGKRYSDQVPGGLRKVTEYLLNTDYKGLKKYLEENSPAPPQSPVESPKKMDRSPSSTGMIKILESMDQSLYQDFFSTENYGKKLRYEVKHHLWTDLNKPHMNKRLHNALDDAIEATLNTQDTSRSLMERLKKNLFNEFMSHFVKGLQLAEIVDGTIQIDLHFIPKEDSPLNFDNELSSNRLIRFHLQNHSGERLSSLLKKIEEETFTSQIRNQAPRIAQLDSNTQKALYTGGVISLYIKLLDTHWKLSNPIPHPKENAVKGFVRYRRYFVMPSFTTQNLISCTSNHLKIEKVQWKNAGSVAPPRSKQFYTVDLYKRFNLADFTPRAETLEIFPGRIMASNKGRNDLLPKSQRTIGKSVHTSSLVLEGQYTEANTPPLHFKHQLQSLVYRFDKKKFDSTSSSRMSTIELMHYPADGSNVTTESISQHSFADLLDQCPQHLSEALQIPRFATLQ